MVYNRRNMASTTITGVFAREILDSRGKPTLEVTVACEGGIGTFGVPSGASTGTHEAVELRDGDVSRFGGQGVLKAATHVNVNIAGALVGFDAQDQRGLDERMIAMDGTPTKSKLGGNAMIGASIAAAKAASTAKGAPLHEYLQSLASDISPASAGRRIPFLCMNLVNGGKHAATRLAFQEYKIVPQTQDIEESLHIGTSIMHALKRRIAKEYGAVNANVGDEGGFAPDLDSIRRPLELLMETAAELNMDHRIGFALDVAASSFHSSDESSYSYNGERHSAEELEATLHGLVRDFPILYIEDPFNEDAYDDFARFNASLRQSSGANAPLVVGDDLTVTNPAMLKRAIDAGAVSGVIIKPNQVGTLTETLECMQMAREHDISCIVSHRSGETNDDFIADLAFAFGVFGIKAGAPQRGERVAKYNRLRQIAAHR